MSMAKLLVEEYHGGASVSVPFMWESEPGTPKVKFRETPLPPLTPPPSYCYTTAKRPIRNPSKSNYLLQAIFPKRASTKSTTTRLPPSPALSSSSSYSSSSSSSPSPSPRSTSSFPLTPWKFRGRGRMASPRLSVDSRMGDEYEKYRSTLCLFGRMTNNNSRY